MNAHANAVSVLASMALFSAAALAGECQIAKVADVHVDVTAGKPVIKGTLEGKDIDILVDTGSVISVVIQTAAMRAGLSPTNVEGMSLVGVGGKIPVKSVTVKELFIGDFPVRDRRWYVTGDAKTDYGALGFIMGRDLLAQFDVELDLAEGKMLWWKPRDCEKSPLAYWNKDFMLAELEPSRDHAIETYVLLNGKKVRAMIDTGAGTTIVDTDAANRAGFREDAPNVEPAGTAGGLGGAGRVASYIAVFDTFDMGDLSVKNARIRVADLNYSAREADTGSHISKESEALPEMLIGRDFLMANRVLVANSQGYIYFTYNGGQIFQTEAPARAVVPDGKVSGTQPDHPKQTMKGGKKKFTVKVLPGGSGETLPPEVMEKLIEELENGKLFDTDGATPAEEGNSQ